MCSFRAGFKPGLTFYKLGSECHKRPFRILRTEVKKLFAHPHYYVAINPRFCWLVDYILGNWYVHWVTITLTMSRLLSHRCNTPHNGSTTLTSLQLSSQWVDDSHTVLTTHHNKAYFSNGLAPDWTSYTNMWVSWSRNKFSSRSHWRSRQKRGRQWGHCLDMCDVCRRWGSGVVKAATQFAFYHGSSSGKRLYFRSLCVDFSNGMSVTQFGN